MSGDKTNVGRKAVEWSPAPLVSEWERDMESREREDEDRARSAEWVAAGYPTTGAR
jgi:hypothetical protein